MSESPKQKHNDEKNCFSPLFIENEKIILQSSSNIELNPLYITEVIYHPLNKEAHYDSVLKLTGLSSDELAKLMTLLTAEVLTLRDKILIFDEISQENLEEVIKICGSDNLSRLLLEL